MKKLLSIYLIITILFVSGFAAAPSPNIQHLYKTVPEIEITIYENLAKTVYPVIMLYCKDYLKAGLGSNAHIDEAFILHLNNQSYQLVTFYFPTLYVNCNVMAVFFGSNIWVRTGILTEDGSVIFDMTEIKGREVEMFVFSNL